MGIPPEIQIRALEPQCPGIGQQGFDTETDHPTEFRRAVAKGNRRNLPASACPGQNRCRLLN